MKPGLFLSQCGGQVAGAIDLEALSRQYAGLPAVRVVGDFYDGADLDALLADVQAKRLESLVLAGDSPYRFRETRNGESLFDYLAQAGVDRNRIELVNLSNLVVRAHKGAPREALQEKAKLLVDVALQKVEHAAALETVEIAPRKAVAVVGGGVAGLLCAQHLLDEGYKVYLVIAGADLGGTLVGVPQLRPTMAFVLRHPRFRLHAQTSPVDFSGYPGDYSLRVSSRGQETELLVGAVILAPEGGSSGVRELQSVFHIDVDDAGRFASRDDATARSQTQDPGVFMVNPVADGAESRGLAGVTTAADAAAAMVLNLLNRTEIMHRVSVSRVDPDLCGGCGVCVKTCLFHAVSLRGTPAVSFIDPRRCRGCGNCVTACPAGARDLSVCPTHYLEHAVDALAGFEHAEYGRKVLLLACDGCGYRCLDNAAMGGQTWPVGVLPLWVVCGGQIDTSLLMRAFVRGFDGVALAICGEGCCHNLIGNVDLERRANLFREVMASRGIAQERLRIVSTCSRKGADCVQAIREFCDSLAPAADAAHTLVAASHAGLRPRTRP